VTEAAFAATWGQSVDDDTKVLVPGETAERVAAYYEAHFGEHADAVDADPAAGAALRRLRARGIPTACVTNSPGGIARQILAAAGLADGVDLLVAAGNGVPPKPAPDMVRVACECLGVRAADALLIGDSRFDREAAEAAGVRFVQFDTKGRRRLTEVVDAALGPETVPGGRAAPSGKEGER
jgi:phosphoglycolate phosphatase/AHBA synthesis associated protein